MLIETSWYDNRGNEDLANVDLDRFAIPLEYARRLDRIRSIMSEKAGREIRIEELMKAAIAQFIEANSALLGKPVAEPPAIPAGRALEEQVRRHFLGMLPPAKPSAETTEEPVPVREFDPVARQLLMDTIP